MAFRFGVALRKCRPSSPTGMSQNRCSSLLRCTSTLNLQVSPCIPLPLISSLASVALKPVFGHLFHWLLLSPVAAKTCCQSHMQLLRATSSLHNWLLCLLWSVSAQFVCCAGTSSPCAMMVAYLHRAIALTAFKL